MNKNTPAERLINGIIRENPTLVLILGMCPTLAVTTSAINGAGMGLSTTVVLMFSNLIISLLRNFIPDRVRIPSYIVVIATLVTIVQFLLQGYVPFLDKALGVYIPLIVVNCIILGRAEAYASKNGAILSFFDGVGMGLGFTLALTILGAFRELLGSGCMFGITILPDTFYTPITIFILAPGAFFVLSCMIAVRNRLNNRKPPEERKELPQGCGDCANCALTGCASRSFFDMSVGNSSPEPAEGVEPAPATKNQKEEAEATKEAEAAKEAGPAKETEEAKEPKAAEEVKETEVTKEAEAAEEPKEAEEVKAAEEPETAEEPKEAEEVKEAEVTEEAEAADDAATAEP